MDNKLSTVTLDNITYDISHLSSQDTKDIMTLVQNIEAINRDIELCSCELSKKYLNMFVSLHKATFNLVVDPNNYKTVKSIFNK